jgi:hypothetical protein
MDIMTLGQVLDILKTSPSLDHAILKVEAHLNTEVKEIEQFFDKTTDLKGRTF